MKCERQKGKTKTGRTACRSRGAANFSRDYKIKLLFSLMNISPFKIHYYSPSLSPSSVPDTHELKRRAEHSLASFAPLLRYTPKRINRVLYIVKLTRKSHPLFARRPYLSPNAHVQQRPPIHLKAWTKNPFTFYTTTTTFATEKHNERGLNNNPLPTCVAELPLHYYHLLLFVHNAHHQRFHQYPICFICIMLN